MAKTAVGFKHMLHFIENHWKYLQMDVISNKPLSYYLNYQASIYEIEDCYKNMVIMARECHDISKSEPEYDCEYEV